MRPFDLDKHLQREADSKARTLRNIFIAGVASFPIAFGITAYLTSPSSEPFQKKRVADSSVSSHFSPNP